MKSDKRNGNPSLDIGHRVIRLSLSFTCYLPFIVEQRCRQLPLQFVNYLELHRVEVPVRLDDLMPQQGDRNSQDRYKESPVGLAKIGRLQAIQSHESDVESQCQ